MTPEQFRIWQAQIGYNNKQVAEAFGVSEPTIRGWRSGDSPIKPMTQMACEYLLQQKEVKNSYLPAEQSL